ncbi:kinase-like domain-containing protein [Roridomyces roridus]|uniref:Kinase-like domain-containing protein n=1 Tax=Roridomyces roridus TaxID=1738132 RepID=A0AAD7CKX9_9AGAR|nr:kinase-like domain-containing protein [Roridomyces roridus]
MQKKVAELTAWLNEYFHRDEKWYKKFLACRGGSAQRLLDLLQDLLDLSLTEQPRLLNALRRLSSTSKLHPRCFPLPHLSNKVHVAGGTFSDVYVASLHDQWIAVKEMRVFDSMEVEIFQEAFSKEAITWRQLSHPNVLPFYGLFKDSSRLCLVSPWMEHGHIRKFLRTQPAACAMDKILSLILDVALGLEYLHKRGVIHADLKSDNILVTPALKACIADFGLSSVKTTMSSLPNFRSVPHGTGALHYQAPELYDNKSTDFRSDIYSFGCVMYELMAGDHPFSKLRPGALICAVIQGCRPVCPPPGCHLEIRTLSAAWRLVEACWAQSPEERPTAAQIVVLLKGNEIGAQETKSAWHWNDTSTSRFRRQLDGRWCLPSVSKLRTLVLGNDWHLVENLDVGNGPVAC